MSLSRRAFLRTTSTLVSGATFAGFVSGAAEQPTRKPAGMGVSELPRGAAPRPLSLSHFPDRLHAFVWRNWPLLPVDRIANVVGARSSDIKKIGHTMGLKKPAPITYHQRARSYITVIKRNWHLLPYEQLLELLGWSAEQLAYTLREDDFLFVKLGNLKPHCEPLRYQALDENTLQQERVIARVMSEEFPEAEKESSEPLFGFIERLSKKSGATRPAVVSDDLRFCYSYFAPYGDPLLEREADPYPEGYLQKLAQSGVTGVWLQAVLYKLALFPWQAGLSAQSEIRLKNLRALVARAKRHGIRVFLYLNEPRAMPLRFFEDHPSLKGVIEGDYAALCTSQPEVQSFLIDAVATICRTVPNLGGLFTITASENLSNCWSHGQGAKCPRCARRRPAEVIGEVNSLFHQGIKRAGTAARLLAWDWGWDDSWTGEAIQHLPAGVELMSVSEWRLPIKRGGVQTEVGEYSISAVGPGPRAKAHWSLARDRGLKAIAKIQAGNTWEISAVPYIPAIENVARHVENLRKEGINGLMLGWTLGGYPSPNLEVVSETLRCGSGDEAMKVVAERRFGPMLAAAAITAWRAFSLAFREFPFHVGVLYSGPQQLGPANLLWSEPTGYQATMVGFPYDDLNSWRGVYPAEIFIEQLDNVADGFASALDELRRVADVVQRQVSTAHRLALESECRIADTVAIHFRSAANQARFVLARRAVAAAKASEDSAPHLDRLEAVLKDEISLSRRLHRIQSLDSCVGFEASNQYYYVPIDLGEKVLNCRYLLENWLPGLRRK